MEPRWHLYPWGGVVAPRGGKGPGHHPEVWKDPSLKTAVVVSGSPSGLYKDPRAFRSGPGVPPAPPRCCTTSRVPSGEKVQPRPLGHQPGPAWAPNGNEAWVQTSSVRPRQGSQPQGACPGWGLWGGPEGGWACCECPELGSPSLGLGGSGLCPLSGDRKSVV